MGHSIFFNIKKNVATYKKAMPSRESIEEHIMRRRMTYILLAITIVVSVCTIYYLNKYPAWKQQVATRMNLIAFYAVLPLLLFGIMTHALVKVEASAVYSMRCIHGKDYRTVATSKHAWYRFLHVLPFVGDLYNIVLFHTCVKD
jgi:heme/copper-type cytochrome/quinol oxidase subunit 2